MTCCISCGRAFTAPGIVRDGVTVHAAEVCGDCFHGWPAHEQRAVAGELRRCPFCAAPAVRSWHETEANVSCQTDGCPGSLGAWALLPEGGDRKATMAEAEAAWNTRAAPWRPISEAPRDGTWVVAWRESKHVHPPVVMVSYYNDAWRSPAGFNMDASIAVFIPLPEDKP